MTGAGDEQRRTQPIAPAERATPPTASGPPWLLPTVAVAVMLSLVSSLGLGLAQWRLATEARDERDRLAAEVALLREEVADLRNQVEAGGASGDGWSSMDPERLLEELLSGLLEGTREGAADLAERLQRWFADRGGTG